MRLGLEHFVDKVVQGALEVCRHRHLGRVSAVSRAAASLGFAAVRHCPRGRHALGKEAREENKLGFLDASDDKVGDGVSVLFQKAAGIVYRHVLSTGANLQTGSLAA